MSEQKQLLLIEGYDDRAVIRRLSRRYGLVAWDTDEAPYKVLDGIERLLENLPVSLKSPGLEQLGIVIDADTDLGARWASVRRILIGSKYTTVPDIPDPAGTIIQEPDLPVVGIWIMPDNQVSGILEDFVARLVPPGDCLWHVANHILDEIPEKDRRFSEVARPKALIHTWLAWQESPGKPIGTAILAGFLDANAPLGQAFISWFRRLYSL